ncbi:transcription termination/antitermination NusG family protein [Aeromonas sp. sif2433]|uniref:transcription termination/antitermination NusG family protein n=1 Tax=Aeromonas sp. sif2433 TaxID=2854794 RepID=UPI001C43C14D|nr:transcription termination/antitermination NusG family protein [Aeromonas sp. sif2433]MBV7414943.1 hypothetical protein [Aeromonas sp. sif2433]
MGRWYLACHKTGKHNAFKVQMFLTRLNVEVFIPQICCRQPRSDRPGHFRSVLEPLFPGYLFVHFDPEVHHTSKIAACPGMSHLVRFGGMVSPLHEVVVDEIMQLMLTVNPNGALPASTEMSRENQVKQNLLLTESQRQQIQRVVEEKDGMARSALLYALAEAIQS